VRSGKTESSGVPQREIREAERAGKYRAVREERRRGGGGGGGVSRRGPSSVVIQSEETVGEGAHTEGKQRSLIHWPCASHSARCSHSLSHPLFLLRSVSPPICPFPSLPLSPSLPPSHFFFRHEPCVIKQLGGQEGNSPPSYGQI